MTIKEIMQDDVNESTVIKIPRILNECGIPAHLLGYEYLEIAIRCVLKNPTLIHRITKDLYPEIAKLVSATPSSVERAIRHAIQYAWQKQDTVKSDIFENTFNHTLKGLLNNPTNSEFIAEILKGIRVYRV